MIYFKISIAILGYLFGAVPFGFIVGKYIAGIDIRKHGSGNIGATNVLRILGVGPGLLVLFLDVMKGFIPTFFGFYFTQQEIWGVIPGIAAIIGHSLSPFLGFKGGKSVATALGFLIGVTPINAVVAVSAFGICLLLTGWVSLASISACLAVGICIWFSGNILTTKIIISIAAVLVTIRHKENIKRLFRGEEPKLCLKKKKDK